MTYRNQLVDEVLLNLAGFMPEQELYGTLSGNITDSATTFTLVGPTFGDAAASGFQTGLIEVGDELCYVGAVNPTTGACTSVIRGFNNTTGYAWTAGTVARDHPRIPRVAVVKAINHAIRGLYPAVFVTGSSEVTAVAGQTGYDLPATVDAVIAVRYEGPAATEAWVEPRAWRFDRKGPSSSATARLLTVSGVPAGRKIQAITASAPTAALSEATGAADEVFESVTGLPEWSSELVVLGACYRLAGFLDAGRVANRTAEGDLLQQQSPTGAAAQLSEYYHGLYTTLLEASRARMVTEALGIDPLQVLPAGVEGQKEQDGNAR